MINFQKAAMFGLDARIALAIFGALSIVSGASLYKAIKVAKVEKYRQYFNELTKASEQYYLDNYQQLPISHPGLLRLYIEDIAVNRESLSTWQGPYWSTTYAAGSAIKDDVTRSFHNDSTVHIFLRQVSTWSEMNDFSSDELCILDSVDCAEWITFYSGNASETTKLYNLFTDLDELLDSGDGTLSGIVRYNSNGAGYLMFKGISHKYEN